MQLIGMLDSPYVRRTAISLRLLNIEFEHRAISVFRTFEQFRQINPVVKAPTLICDDGTVLMDSPLIIDHVERLAGRSLMPAGIEAHRQASRRIGLALAVCEKAIQIVYERMRPGEKQHEAWVDRVQGQLAAAATALESELAGAPPEVSDERKIDQAAVTIAVAWRFTQEMLPEIVRAKDHPTLVALGAAAEKLPAFVVTPFE